jgi:ATP phosphoribosyltransferase regulatory subunit
MRLEPPVPADVLAAIRAPFAELGAPFVDAPVVLPLGLMLDLAGETMRGRLFLVQGDGEDACLRPDFTIPIARAHIEGKGGDGRYLYEGKAFRVAPRGSERAEEFLQIGMEAFGEHGAQADAEVAGVAWRAAAAGGRDDLVMILGDVALFSALVDTIGLAPSLAARLKRAFARPGALVEELARAQTAELSARQGDRIAELLAGLPEAQAAAVLQDLWSIAGIPPVGGRTASEIAHRLVQRGEAARAPRLTPGEAKLVQDFIDLNGAPRAALDGAAALARAGKLNLDAELEAWARRLDAIVARGAPEDRLVFQADFGRPFSYYDGFLFEVRSPALGDEAPVAAGGRYDSLPAHLGGASSGAVGCAVRPGRAWARAERAS